MSPIIEVQQITKRFGDLIAVDNLSFTVASGETLGLLGANGAGKTTTMQLLLGLTTPTSGVARIFGLDIRRQRCAILQRVNFSSAYTSLPTNLTVWENLNVFAHLYGLRQPRHKIQTLLDLFEIPETLKQVTGELSSGQLTRLNLCKAFLNDPEVLFLDEPTASLDPAIAAKVRATLQQMQQARRVTMLYTSHNMNVLLFAWAMGMATMAVILRYGMAGEGFGWAAPFLIQPFAAVFYPVTVFPPWLQTVAYCLPLTYVFESMRAVLHTDTVNTSMLLEAFGLNLVYLAAGAAFLSWMLWQARWKGYLSRLGLH